jgi:hypothetical protein
MFWRAASFSTIAKRSFSVTRVPNVVFNARVRDSKIAGALITIYKVTAYLLF